MYDKNYRNNFAANGIYYEKNFNLLYITKNYSPSSKSNVLKIGQPKDSSYSNVFIWDITQQQKKALFSEEMAAEYQLQRLVFEQDYDEKEQQIIFNENNSLLNNLEIPFRHPKNLLLIETYHPISEKSQLWVSNKQGEHLKKIIDLDSKSIWHLDVCNSCIRVIQHLPKNVEITEIKW